MTDTLVTTWLEMRERAEFRPAFLPPQDRHACRILPLERLDPDFYLFLYRAVGEAWRWRHRAQMPREDLARALAQPGLGIDVLYVAGAPAGYIEMLSENRETQVVYFGIRQEFFGRGLGKHLLSAGVQRAWDEGAERVWVHTCNLDAPQALANYRRRGFRITCVEEEPMPALLRDP